MNTQAAEIGRSWDVLHGLDQTVGAHRARGRGALRHPLDGERAHGDLVTLREVSLALVEPSRAGGSGLVSWASLSRPAREVGGDFHAVHRLQSGGLEVVVGVVLGEGFAATLLGAACLDHVSRAAASVDGSRPLGAILTQANRTLSPELIRQSTLAKTALVRVDGDPLCLTIADAGHGNIAIRSLDGTVFEPRGRETLLGLEHRPFRESSIVLSHGDLVLVFTQGLSRITSALGVGFDVAEWLGETKAETPVELLDALSKEIERGTGAADGSEDDITCIAIGVNGPREGN